MRLQTPWINNLSEGLSIKDIQIMHGVLNALRKKLERSETNERV